MSRQEADGVNMTDAEKDASNPNKGTQRRREGRKNGEDRGHSRPVSMTPIAGGELVQRRVREKARCRIPRNMGNSL